MNLHDGKWKACKAGDVPIMGIWRHSAGSTCWLRILNTDDVKIPWAVIGVGVQADEDFLADLGRVAGCGACDKVELYIGE